MDKLVIIDGNSLINRAFYALPMLANFEGEISNAVFGFSNILVKIITEIKPKYLCVAFDYGKKTFRNELYAEYKGTRKGTPQELISQFPILKNLLKAMNVTIIEREGIEADDIIGSLSKKYDVQNLIITGDKDAFQLINDNTKVILTKKGISETLDFDEKLLLETYGISPSQVVELKALMGDSSDNIPGVAGVGEKTAVNLLTSYKTLDGVYENIDEIKGKLKEKLIADKENAYLSKQLATIKTDAEIDFTIEDFVYDFPFNENVLEIFKRYQFNALLKRTDLFEAGVENVVVNNVKDVEVIKITAFDADFYSLINLAKKHKKMYIALTDTLNIFTGNKEFVFDFNQDLFSANLTAEDTFENLKVVLEEDYIEKYVYDYKSMLHTLKKYNRTITNVVFDAMIARYLINNNAKSNIAISDMFLEQNINSKNIGQALSIACENFQSKLDEYDLNNLFLNVEMPLCRVLFDMEQQGFKIDIEELQKLDLEYKQKIDELTAQIHELAGEVFNINSPKQLSEVLFDKLKLSTYNNKKNSTGVEILERLKTQHAVIEPIMEYRKVTKLYSTYIKAFLDITDKNTHKIHTLFNQTLTSTGRLSSVEPNLQNIPVRTEEGKNFRKVFISSFENGYIVSADYSQIELRLLAAFSEDPILINSFNSGIDIHSLTASQIFGVELSEVTSDMRRDAKAVNFGIIYGISDYGLSQNINSSVATASNYITKYFEKYPKIKEYMDKNIEECKQNGFVKTIFGRIRFIMEINSSNYNLRQFGERAAMNMPLQGSASDIIKLAMVNVANEFKKLGLKSKLILQIHDELLVDCAEDELEIVKQTLQNCMENVVDLAVKLSVNIDFGKNWFES